MFNKNTLVAGVGVAGYGVFQLVQYAYAPTPCLFLKVQTFEVDDSLKGIKSLSVSLKNSGRDSSMLHVFKIEYIDKDGNVQKDQRLSTLPKDSPFTLRHDFVKFVKTPHYFKLNYPICGSRDYARHYVSDRNLSALLSRDLLVFDVCSKTEQIGRLNDLASKLPPLTLRVTYGPTKWAWLSRTEDMTLRPYITDSIHVDYV